MTGTELVDTILVALAALASVVGLATGKAPRLVAGASLVLVAVALRWGWTSDADH